MVCDDVAGSRVECGDLLRAAAVGCFDWDDAVELHAIAAGKVDVPRPTDAPVLFETQGVAIQDVAVCALAYERYTPTPTRDSGGQPMITSHRLSLEEAEIAVDAALAKAAELGVGSVVCVCDAAGWPIAVKRPDNGKPTSVEISINKAFTAACHRRPTHTYTNAQPGQEAFGIMNMHQGRFSIFVGGWPIEIDGEVVGGIGVSGGHTKEDIACCQAGITAVLERLGKTPDFTKWDDSSPPGDADDVNDATSSTLNRRRVVAASDGTMFERRNPAERDRSCRSPQSRRRPTSMRPSPRRSTGSAAGGARRRPTRRRAGPGWAAARRAGRRHRRRDGRRGGQAARRRPQRGEPTPKNLELYAGEAYRLTGATFPSDDTPLVYSVLDPVGVVAVITPWNFPLNLASRKIGPALAAGNAVVFKPSPMTPLMGDRLAQAFVDAGLPPGVLNVVHGFAAGAHLVAHDEVAAVAFTGSTEVGRKIHAASHLGQRLQLELGGKNPVVVLADADLDVAADVVARSSFSLSGQACTGAGRVLVEETIHDQLLDAVVERGLVGTSSGVAMPRRDDGTSHRRPCHRGDGHRRRRGEQ